MTDQAIADRIQGRKEAEQLLSLVLLNFQESAYIQGFCAALRRHADKYDPPPPVNRNAPLEPMSDERAKLFESEMMPYGKHAGELIGDVASKNPRYLIWLADAPTDFQHDLKRYLRNPNVSRDLEGDDE